MEFNSSFLIHLTVALAFKVVGSLKSTEEDPQWCETIICKSFIFKRLCQLVPTLIRLYFSLSKLTVYMLWSFIQWGTSGKRHKIQNVKFANKLQKVRKNSRSMRNPYEKKIILSWQFSRFQQLSWSHSHFWMMGHAWT